MSTPTRLQGFKFGPEQNGWVTIVGDWNEDGTDNIGLYKDGVWRLRNSNSAGATDLGFTFNPNGFGSKPLASYRGGIVGLEALGLLEIVETPEVAITATPTATISLETTPEVTEELTASETATEQPTQSPEVTNTPAPVETATPYVVETPTAPRPDIAPTEVVTPEATTSP